MKERPILFSTDMIKAILDGKKTMTRRIVKPQPYQQGWAGTIPLYQFGEYTHGHKLHGQFKQDEIFEVCPYGLPDDRLWVRETWAAMALYDKLPPINIPEGTPIWYKDSDVDMPSGCGDDMGKWRPSIFIPRWASRITLEITEVRVERLQEIQPYDAEKEGFALAGLKQCCSACDTKDHSYYGGHIHFAEYWQKLNAKRGYSWESNPWVWVVSFKKL